jgi:molybdate transport system substrate-binding protein
MGFPSAIRHSPSAMKLLVGCLALLQALAAHAAEVRVLSPSAMHSSLEALAEAFQKRTGNEVRLAFETAPAMRKKLAAGEVADVIIVPPPAMAEVVKMGKAAASGHQLLGRVGVGVVIRADAPVPDVSSTDALKRALLDADSVAYNRASSGVYVEKLMEKLGLAETLKAKTVRHHDAQQSFTHLLNGKGREIGFGGTTEIVRWRDKGLRLVGPLPADIQNYTSYLAALAVDAPNPDGARAFLKFLEGADAKAIFRQNGVD